MSTVTTTAQTAQKPTTGIKSLSNFLSGDAIKAKFTEVLGNSANGFISSLLSLASNDKALVNADQPSIYTAALLAASLKLEINPNLGQAYIIAYNSRQADGTFKCVAQFQIGYKGIKQLAQRTGKYKFINESDVREGELKNWDRMTGEITFDWNQDIAAREKLPIIGYMSYFELNNGFKSTLYMTAEEIESHAKEYSQTYKKYNSGLWKDKKVAMALKTVVKLNLSKNGPLSVEMQKAVVADQAVITNDSFVESKTVDIPTEYVDNPEPTKIETVEDKKEAVKKAKAEAKEQAKPEAKAQPKTEPKDITVHEAVVVSAEESDADIYTKIGNCKTLQELAVLEKLIPKDDHDLEVLVHDKKTELSSQNKGGLFDAKSMA